MNAYHEVQTSSHNWGVPAQNTQYRSVQELLTHPPIRPYTSLFDGLESDMGAFAVEHEAFLQEVRRHFVVSDPSVTRFLTEHRSIPQTLVEAAIHLKECFGSEVVFNLRMTVDETGAHTLDATVIWPGRVEDARNALAKFDDWWLAQPRPGAGYLTFTYELF